MGGAFGEAVSLCLDGQDIDHVPIRIEDETRLSFAVVEEEAERHFRFSTPGPNLDDGDMTRIVTAVERIVPDWCVISGGMPSSVTPDFYARLVGVIADTGAKVIVDTHGEPLRTALDSGRVFLAKPNYRELFDITGRSADEPEPDVVEAARSLIGQTGTVAVLVSLGAAGATLITREHAERFSAPTVPIRSRIGAGDSMVGGLVWRLASGDDLTQAVRYAVAAGSAAVMTPGTQLCRRKDVERLHACLDEPGAK